MLTNHPSGETRTTKSQSRNLTSSGGFTTPTTPPVLSLCMSNEKTPLASPRSSHRNPFQSPDDHHLSHTTPAHDIPMNSSTSSSPAPSPQQYSPAPVRTAPFCVSVYTSSPPIPLVRGTSATSAPPVSSTNPDDDSFFTRRSPSPQPPLMLKKLERTNAFDYHQPK